MTIRDAARRFGSGTAALYRRYAEWLVSISWKRFIVLSILFMIAIGVLSGLPPFTWDLVPPRTEATGPLHANDGDVEVTVDARGVQIRRKADPATGKPAREIVIDDKGVQISGRKADKPADGVADEIKAEIGALADEIREEVAGAMSEARPARVKHVRLGDHLPSVAFLLVLLSAVIKIAYAGRVKAEAQAAQAQEVADAESLKRQVLEARMAAMQAQVEPHFLFNTLASIDHLIEVDPPRASRMQKHLIALLRASMPAMREKSASLGRELDVVRPYLEILKMRMGERLRVEVNVPEGLSSAEFPPMMLQSLVENAIKHGLEPKAEGGSLTVSAEVVHGKLAVSVADTGVGFGRAPTAGTGTGLNNIRERLRLLYGEAAELKIGESTPTGTRASIVVPYKAQA
jgi:signal transduction histidine kinase